MDIRFLPIPLVYSLLHYFRYINQSQETKNILGESKSTQMYLANRLNISMDDVEDMFEKMPALRTMRVTKVPTYSFTTYQSLFLLWSGPHDLLTHSVPLM